MQDILCVLPSLDCRQTCTEVLKRTHSSEPWRAQMGAGVSGKQATLPFCGPAYAHQAERGAY